MRKGIIYYKEKRAGLLSEGDHVYEFIYDQSYLEEEDAMPVSLTLPLSEKPYRDRNLFPFFDGIIPEGWLLSIAQRNWKINPRDRMGLLLSCCRDCIGAVSVIPAGVDDHE